MFPPIFVSICDLLAISEAEPKMGGNEVDKTVVDAEDDGEDDATEATHDLFCSTCN